MTVPARRPTTAVDPFAARGSSAGGDSFEVDLTGVTSGPSWQIPVGVWPAKVVEVKNGVSGAGNRKIVWTLSVIGGPHRGKQQQFHTAITERAMWKIDETTKAIGLESGGGVLRFRANDVIDRVCAIVVEEQTGQDNVVRPQITRLVHWGEFADEPIFIETAERLGLTTVEEGEAPAPAATRGAGVPR